MKSVLYSILPALVAAGPGINPNPNPNFDPSTSQGTFGPFIPAQKAAVVATGGPTQVDARSLQAMQLAISNWQTDTGIVSMFLNNGGSTTDSNQFTGIADGAFKAEVDELTQKAALDKVIGNDPRVSIANLTLTNGVFQSVVDNLQIMSLQGQARVNLINTINSVRCTQILPSIDTYLVVAAEYIGSNAQQRRAVRPNACQQILTSSNSSAFPNAPGTPNGTPQGLGDGNISGIPGACQQGAGNLAISANSTSNNRNSGNSGSGNAANSPLPNVTTPQLGGIVGSSAPSASPSASASASASASTPTAQASNTGTGQKQNGPATQNQKGQASQTQNQKQGQNQKGRSRKSFLKNFRARAVRRQL